MLHRLEDGRGRPNGRYHSQADTQIIEYLAKVSIKYGIDSDRFFSSLFKAHENRKSKCGNLLIECRLKERDSAVFLITTDWKVVGQFRISGQLFKERTNPLKQFVSRLSATRTLAQKNESFRYKIKDLRTGMRKLNVNAQVLEISQPIQVTTRSGFSVNLVNALIADETGTIKLSLLGDQIKKINLHDVIQIENAHVAWFRSERQLRIGKQGKICVLNSTENNNLEVTNSL